MKRQQNLLQWYTRRNGVTRGPFSAANITRYILLGRIRLEDELSRDRVSWSAAEQLTTLLPEPLRNMHSGDAYRQLIAAQMQADEREAERRCSDRNNPGNSRDRRRLPDRREPSGAASVTFQHRIKPLASRSTLQPQLRTVLLAVLLASMLLALLLPTRY